VIPERPVFLDACVLYPPVMRALILGAAEAGLFTPAWSARVLAEWRIAVARKEGPEAALAVDAAQARLRAAFPEGEAVPDPDTEAALVPLLPDPADAHVLAGARAAGAGTLLTLNLRDFPRRLMAGEGIAARHPDGVLWELASHAPERFAALVRAATGTGDPAAQRRALKRARLPRLGKAMEAGAGGP
jgi:predicted nucleic acid-binding protein